MIKKSDKLKKQNVKILYNTMDEIKLYKDYSNEELELLKIDFEAQEKAIPVQGLYIAAGSVVLSGLVSSFIKNLLDEYLKGRNPLLFIIGLIFVASPFLFCLAMIYIRYQTTLKQASKRKIIIESILIQRAERVNLKEKRLQKK
ncbi:hypothetical protein [Paenibacillus radicis (ex Xue et al. 2023)]|uniref:MFS transporter n=1 Tax=Paenibacillus radicis (ex Xue et al. 2023) TaxID=2972489 RepID=A0ABT1YVJ4_9BACL|nr:hypothetical protein [Paenibacillus radicis (ex Xue et al. 2023)]MCR8636953.1 hypothetical protein [Paenibacillus radicis (ex Xue et al. 2023)]